MRTNLALQNILHNLPRTIVALAGIGVAIVLMFMQLGFRGAVENTATNLFESMEFDLLVRSPGYLHFVEPGALEADFLNELRSLKAVREVVPLQVGLAGWLRPDQTQLRGLMVLGIDPLCPPFDAHALPVHWDCLQEPGSLMIDTRSSREFGPENGREFGVLDLGKSAELNGQRFCIRGFFALGAGLTADGSVVTSLRGFQRLAGDLAGDRVAMGLIRLQPSVDLEAAREEMQSRFTSSDGSPLIDVLTRQEVIRRELDRWINQTPIGFIFSLGVLLSLVVGGAIFYMILATDVAKRLPEYATLRAMGYPDWQLAGFVLQQAFWLGLFAFFPALLAGWGGYRLTELAANIPISMNMGRIFLVFCLTQVMCFGSGLFALRKLFQAEPAALF